VTDWRKDKVHRRRGDRVDAGDATPTLGISRERRALKDVKGVRVS